MQHPGSPLDRQMQQRAYMQQAGRIAPDAHLAGEGPLPTSCCCLCRLTSLALPASMAGPALSSAGRSSVIPFGQLQTSLHCLPSELCTVFCAQAALALPRLACLDAT